MKHKIEHFVERKRDEIPKQKIKYHPIIIIRLQSVQVNTFNKILFSVFVFVFGWHISNFVKCLNCEHQQQHHLQNIYDYHNDIGMSDECMHTLLRTLLM